MYRYVAVLFALLAVHDLRSLAAGNIGCLFSDTLCEQDREWCFDDRAFGHCLSAYNHVKERDLFRYDLGPEDLRVLEHEMQRLFLLGYRWSHAYTQCVLQNLLHTIREEAEYDISGCNNDLDQDLEGALRAIEGEEQEQVDPRDLAIVRFTPSATDPHSDYADEVYVPPVKDQHSFEEHPDADHDQQESGRNESDDGGDAGGGGGGGEDNRVAPHQHQQESSNSGSMSSSSAPFPNNHQAPPPLHDSPASNTLPDLHPQDLNYFNYYGNGFEDEDEDAYGGSPYHYQPVSNPVYRKRGMEVGPPELQPEEVPSLSAQKLRQLKEIAERLSNMRLRDPPMDSYKADETIVYPERYVKDDEDMVDDEEGEEEDEDEDTDGVFEEGPARPMYSEAGRLFVPELDDEKDEELMLVPPEEVAAIWANSPGGLRPVPASLRNLPEDLRNMPDMYDNLWNLPGDMRNVPEGLRNFPGPIAQYMAQETFFPGGPLQENSISRLVMQEEPPPRFENNRVLPQRLLMEEDLQGQMGRNAPRMSALQRVFGQQFNNLQDYPDYGLLDEYGDYGEYDEAQLRDDRTLPASLQKFVKKDEESANDYGDLPSELGWNFQRAERLDVKKPGPFFKSVNNYAFDDTANPAEEQVEEEDLEKGDDLDTRDLLLPQLLQGSRRMQEDTRNQVLTPQARVANEQFPDLLLADEGFVGEAEDDGLPDGKPQMKHEEKKEAVKEGEEGEKAVEGSSAPASAGPPSEEPPKKSTNVYVVVDGQFRDKMHANQLAKEVVKLSGLSEEDYDQLQLSLEKDVVTFRIKENPKGVTPAQVAAKAEEHRDDIKQHLGLDVSKTGIGSPLRMEALVFNSSEKHMLAAAAVVCGVMAALLVAATVLFFLRRQAKAKAKLPVLSGLDTEASKDYEALVRDRIRDKAEEGSGGKGESGSGAPQAAPGNRIASISKDSDNGNNSSSPRSSTGSWSEEPVLPNMDISTGHMVLSYMEDHLKNKDRLEQEWIALCAYEAEPCATTLALKPENNMKNRYPDSVPYDHNRVVLNAHANLNGSDYMNASCITDHDPRNPAYIATQGPLESTAADFWQLVWEQGSVVIVMLTRLTENGHALCHRYWPEEGSDLYHIYEVHLVSEHIWCDDYLVRSFYLKNVKTGETRTVTQFHFLSWPDSATPASTKALLEFRRKVNKSYRGRSCPIIVHCSDGIGRTGTYCLIDMVLNRMAKGAKEIDIAATLEHIRDQRPHMVKSKSQFEFVLMAVAEEVHAILKALPQ